jgi:hypothetical protein
MLKTGSNTRRKAKSKPRASRAHGRVQSGTRRTTLTLPVDLLEDLKDLATNRRQTLSAAATCLLKKSLVGHLRKSANGASVLEMLRRSYAHLTEEERMLVDGIILEETELEPK